MSELLPENYVDANVSLAEGSPLLVLTLPEDMRKVLELPEFDRLEQSGVASVEGGGSLLVGLDLTRVGQRNVPSEKVLDLQAINVVLGECFNGTSYDDNGYRRFGVSIGRYDQPVFDRLMMFARVMRPDSYDTDISRKVTDYMVQASEQLGYGSLPGEKVDMTGCVYCGYGNDRGITLETNPLVSCSLDTDGDWYDPKEDWINMYGHNVYSPEIQLILFTGLVALAKVDDLVA